MTFKQLFEHLKIYVENPEWRWRHCVRVKRGLLNPNDIGGYGKDQCYFEGKPYIMGLEKNLSLGFATNKGADQPAHTRRLISAFVIRFLESIISKLPPQEISIF